MTFDYMTTEQFERLLRKLGFRAEDDSRYGRNYINVYENDDMIAYIDTDRRCVMRATKEAENDSHELLFKIIRAYANTPVCERDPKTYKLKILYTDLYLIHINEHETTVTTNKKAAKAYDDAGVYDAKVLAEKQGFALRAEVINVAD